MKRTPISDNGKFQHAQARRKDDADRIITAQVSPQSVEGSFLVDGAGEAVQTLVFPVKFIEKPNIKVGGELHLDTNPVPGQFPTMSCVVNRWVTDFPGAEGYTVATLKLYFVGAEICVVTTGPTTQRMWIHWEVSGKAIQNPAASAGLTSNSVI